METWYTVTFRGTVEPVLVAGRTEKSIMAATTRNGKTTLRRKMLAQTRWSNGFFKTELEAYESIAERAADGVRRAQERLDEEIYSYTDAKEKLKLARERCKSSP